MILRVLRWQKMEIQSSSVMDILLNLFYKKMWPTYRVIHDGAWHSDKTYATIHRIASDGMVKHCLKTVVDFAKTKVDYVRLDTHEDNKIMQHLAQKCGFKYCGIIYVADGTPRLAYDLLKA